MRLLMFCNEVWKRLFFVLLQALNIIRHESELKCLGDDNGLSIIKQPTYHIPEFQHLLFPPNSHIYSVLDV